MTWEVTVRGTASAAARPDRAVLVFDITQTAPTPGAALDDVAGRTALLQRVLHDRGIGDDDWTTTGVTVQPLYEWRRDQHTFLGHRAVNRIQVTTRDPSLVGRLLTDGVEVASARVGGPEWVVEHDNPAHAEACRLAAVDARRRAEAYAAALGVALGPVTDVDETSAEASWPHPRHLVMSAAAPSDASAPIEVNAGDMEVSAEVKVTFAIVSPT